MVSQTIGIRSLAISVIALSFTVNSAGVKAQEAGRQVAPILDAPLLSGASCVASPTGRAFVGLREQQSDISVGRQFYRSPFYLGAGRRGETALLTCQADPRTYRLLRLRMGVADSSDADTRMTVYLYQGGDVRYTHQNIRPGAIINTVLDFADPQVNGQPYNFAIEVLCHHERTECNLHALEAELVHISSIGSTAAPADPNSALPAGPSAGSQSSQGTDGSSDAAGSNVSSPEGSSSSSSSESRGGGISPAQVIEDLRNIFRIFR